MAANTQQRGGTKAQHLRVTMCVWMYANIDEVAYAQACHPDTQLFRREVMLYLFVAIETMQQ